MTVSNQDQERKTAIHMLRSGCSPQEVAAQLGRSLVWVYMWQGRFEQEGWSGLQDRSRAPKQHGRRLAPAIGLAIRRARSELEAEAAEGRGLKYWGARAVRARLKKDQVSPLPSIATIERVLRAAGMTRRASRQPQPVKYPHLCPTQAHQLVQVDIVPHFLKGGAAVACFNAIDVVSHYPTGQALAQRRAQDAVAFLVHTWQELGLPQYSQVDNEGCFSGGFTHKGVLGQVLRLALLVGTELVFSPVRHPESNGTVERFHQDYNRHVWDETVLQDRSEVNQQGATFFQAYRHSAHHSALNEQTPDEVHHRLKLRQLPADFNLPSGKLPLTVGQVHFIRRVQPDATVSVLNLAWPVPDPEPNKGVWVTIHFTLTGATLRIYDSAPDVTNRRCLAAYPFPLSEKVQPSQTNSLEQTNSKANPQGAILLQLPLKLLAQPVRSTVKMVANFF